MAFMPLLRAFRRALVFASFGPAFCSALTAQSDGSYLITTVAGDGNTQFPFGPGENVGDGGPAILAQLYNPAGVAVDATGNLFIADRTNGRVRKVTPQGIISTVAEFYLPPGVAVDR